MSPADTEFDTFLNAPKLWSPDTTKDVQMNSFREEMNAKWNMNMKNYEDLWQWSVNSYDQFWGSFFEWSKVVHSVAPSRTIDTSIKMSDIPKWFPDCRLNFAENLLRHNDERNALCFTGEGHSELRWVTYRQLRQEVAKCAAGLKALGVTVNDRVTGYMPNCVETIVAMLAAGSLGAIWSSTSCDFGEQAVIERFAQIDPKVVFSVNAVTYNGKVHSQMAKLKNVVNALPCLQKVVVLDFTKEQEFTLDGIPNSVRYSEFVQPYEENTPELTFEQLPFHHPMYIMYSSGTTGKPKCIVHSAGGTLIQHLKEHMLHNDLRREDTIFQYTTCGWMMWQWLVSALAVGATVVLWEGSPFKPSPMAMWDLIDKVSINIFGTSATYVAALEAAGVKPRESHNLSSLRSITSTGSTLTDESFDYVYRDIKSDLLLGSISGGTDIIGCFVGSNPTLPVYRGESQSCNLGMHVQSYDGNGKPCTNIKGDLVCVKPFPSMPVFFWGDEDGSKYRAAYFDDYEGIWCHGDFVFIREDTGGIRMLGRSDATLNPAGVRFGSAELYNVLITIEGVKDSLAVGQKLPTGEERVILFVQTKEGANLDAEMIKSIKTLIRSKLSPRHVPALILPIADIPYTMNGKKVEVAVKKIIHGQSTTNQAALRNPECLDLYKNIPELQPSGKKALSGDQKRPRTEATATSQ